MMLGHRVRPRLNLFGPNLHGLAAFTADEVVMVVAPIAFAVEHFPVVIAQGVDVAVGSKKLESAVHRCQPDRTIILRNVGVKLLSGHKGVELI